MLDQRLQNNEREAAKHIGPFLLQLFLYLFCEWMTAWMNKWILSLLKLIRIIWCRANFKQWSSWQTQLLHRIWLRPSNYFIWLPNIHIIFQIHHQNKDHHDLADFFSIELLFNVSATFVFRHIILYHVLKCACSEKINSFCDPVFDDPASIMVIFAH